MDPRNPRSTLSGATPLAASLRPSGAPPEPLGTSAFLLYALMVVIWGTTWYVIRIGLDHYPPFFSIAVRFLIAGSLLLGWLRLRRVPIPWGLRHQPFFLALGLLQFSISYGVVYWCEQYLPSGLTAILFALLPLLTAILAHWMIADERMTWARGVGLLVSLAGIVMINLSDLTVYHPRAPVAGWVMLLSPIAVSVAAILGKRRARAYPPAAMAGLPMLYGSLPVLVVWFLTERGLPVGWSWPGVGAIAYLTVFGSVVTFAIYYRLLRGIAVSRLSLTAYLVPLVAVAVGVGIGGEALTPPVIVGSALVLSGVAVANRR